MVCLSTNLLCLGDKFESPDPSDDDNMDNGKFWQRPSGDSDHDDSDEQS